MPAQHLLTCTNGHLDEFPYELWVHPGRRCAKAERPDLKMRDANLGKSVGSMIACTQCGATRGMAEAQGSVGRDKLPQTCRGRHPHLNAFDKECGARPALIMMGASNLWFASTQSIIVMPRTDAEKAEALGDLLRLEVGVDTVKQFAGQLDVIRTTAGLKNIDLTAVSDESLSSAIADALSPPESEEERKKKRDEWDPVELLVPEWQYLQKPALFPSQKNTTGLMVTDVARGPELPDQISPGRRGQPDEKGQRLHRIHPARRDGSRQRPARSAGQTDPQRQTDVGARNRGPRRGNLPAAQPRCS